MKRVVILALACLVLLAVAGAALLSNARFRAWIGFPGEFAANDWPQLGRSSERNSAALQVTVPTVWNVDSGENLRWSRPLGTYTAASPAIAGGNVFIGTIDSHSNDHSVGQLICLDEQTGDLLWQHSSEYEESLSEDGVSVAVSNTPVVERDRLFFITHQGQVQCLDVNGFRDSENDGPYQDEESTSSEAADIVWSFEMKRELGVVPNPAGSSSPTVAGQALLICTSHSLVDGVGEPTAPSFVALDKATGELLWSDASPDRNLINPQWSSPAFFETASGGQAIFAGGDGWLYSFDPDGNGDGGAKLLWKFDCTPKHTEWILGGQGMNVRNQTRTRYNILSTPIIHDGMVYVTGMLQRRGMTGHGIVWCIDASKHGDVSPTVATDLDGVLVVADHSQGDLPLVQAREEINAKSAAIWTNIEFADTFDGSIEHSIGRASVADGLLFVADVTGWAHCFDAKTGLVWWTHRLTGPSYSTPLLADGKVFIPDTEGTVSVFAISNNKKLLAEHRMGEAVRSSIVAANDCLFVASQNRLFAISEK